MNKQTEMYLFLLLMVCSVEQVFASQSQRPVGVLSQGDERERSKGNDYVHREGVSSISYDDQELVPDLDDVEKFIRLYNRTQELQASVAYIQGQHNKRQVQLSARDAGVFKRMADLKQQAIVMSVTCDCLGVSKDHKQKMLEPIEKSIVDLHKKHDLFYNRDDMPEAYGLLDDHLVDKRKELYKLTKETEQIKSKYLSMLPLFYKHCEQKCKQDAQVALDKAQKTRSPGDKSAYMYDAQKYSERAQQFGTMIE